MLKKEASTQVGRRRPWRCDTFLFIWHHLVHLQGDSVPVCLQSCSQLWNEEFGDQTVEKTAFHLFPHFTFFFFFFCSKTWKWPVLCSLFCSLVPMEFGGSAKGQLSCRIKSLLSRFQCICDDKGNRERRKEKRSITNRRSNPFRCHLLFSWS